MSSQSLFTMAWLLGALSVILLGTGLVMERHERVVARRRERRLRATACRVRHEARDARPHPPRVTPSHRRVTVPREGDTRRA